VEEAARGAHLLVHPLIIERDGKAQAVVTATGKIRSYDVASGEVLWECGGLTRNVIPCPVAEAGMVYCMSGFQGNALLAIRLGRTGDLTGSDAIAWTHNKSTPYVPSPLLCNGKLYFFANNNGVLSCLDTKSGDPLFEAQKLEDLAGVYASPLGAADKVYLAGRNGVTVVLKAVRQAGSTGCESARREVRCLACRRRQGTCSCADASTSIASRRSEQGWRAHRRRSPQCRMTGSRFVVSLTWLKAAEPGLPQIVHMNWQQMCSWLKPPFGRSRQ